MGRRSRQESPRSSEILEEKKDPTDIPAILSSTGAAAMPTPPPPPPSKNSRRGGNHDEEVHGDVEEAAGDDDEDEEEIFHDALSPSHDHGGGGSEDPYIYSDDSASLSDAYFYPTDDDLARPPRYREQDPLQYTLATYYGSVLRREQLSSLKEDDVLPPDSTPTTTTTSSSAPTASTGGGVNDPSSKMAPSVSVVVGGRRKRRSQRREAALQRRLRNQRNQQNQNQPPQRNWRDQPHDGVVSRETAVAQIRGQRQDPTVWRDGWCAVLFAMQLILVLACAGAFGFGLLPVQSASFPMDGRFHWQQSLPSHGRHTVGLTDSPSLGDVVYADDAPPSHTSSPGGPQIPTPLSAAAETLFTLDYQNVVALVGITGFYSCVLAYISFGCMLILAKALIHVMLVFSILVSLAWGVIGLTLDPYGAISVLGFVALLLALGHTIFNWNRIPFAATNLHVALCGIRCTADLTLLGVASLAVAFGWCVVWSMALVGLINALNSLSCHNYHDPDQKSPSLIPTVWEGCDPYVELRHLPLYALLVGSFVWTNAVIKNIVRVVVASTIGTWWTRPNDIRPFCTSAVSRPLLQALTTSFGSICLGSLVVNPAQVVSVLGQCCCCVFGHPDCTGIGIDDTKDIEQAGGADSAADSVGLGRRLYHVGTPLSRLIRCCNRWSFTYIGLYGYGFREAGDRAIQLFETREWLDVVHDNLIQNVLLMASVVIGGSTGTFAVVVEETDGYYFAAFHMPTFVAFVIGCTLGFVLSNILLLGVVGSAVNTILVCFASFPFEFDANHRRLSDELREMWSQQVWEPQV